jgi:transposase
MTQDSIGIDVSKDHLDVYALSNGRAARFGNDAAGFRKF